MRVKLWGTRGSVPAANPRQRGYGGNTPCVEVETAARQRLILDGGMGLHWLGRALLEDGFDQGRGQAHLLLTHTHWGHIQGIPFCTPPMLIAGNRFTICGPGHASASLADLLAAQMDPAYCPVPNFLDPGIGADLDIREIDEGEFKIGGARILARRVKHVPDAICLGYRLEDGAASLAYLPDVEYLEDAHRAPAVELARGVDLLLHDAHFTTAEYPRQRGRGHACNRDAVEIAREAKVGQLLLFHHHPDRADITIDAVVRAYARQDIPVQGAREGAEYVLGEDQSDKPARATEQRSLAGSPSAR